MEKLSEKERQRLEVIEELLAASSQENYREQRKVAAEKLTISDRSVRRLMQRWQEAGVSGVSWRRRSDRGESRLPVEWQEFIVKTYREGNRGSRRMTRAQVAVRVKVRAQELGIENYPSRMTVYRILEEYKEVEQGRERVRSLGWRGASLSLKTRCGQEIVVEYSNQVWQCDHTKVDVLIVDSSGEMLGRPWLTTVIDSYSRCIMGVHIGMEVPSAAIVCLALRQAILPKQYSAAYGLSQEWGTYGLPQYLYTDGGKEFQSQHLEQVGIELGFVTCLRRRPSDGGIVERPFGTFNSELFSTLPGYTGSNVKSRPKQAETEACLTLMQLEKLLVRYIVERYNQGIDARMGGQTRIGRWEAGRIAQLPLLSERELDICLMRRERRTVYRGGYVQFANLTYKGEHLAAYAGERVVLRYNPRDITSVLVYQSQGDREIFLTRAHALGLETEELTLAEAQAMSRRLLQAGFQVCNQSLLEEVRSRDAEVNKYKRRQREKRKASVNAMAAFSCKGRQAQQVNAQADCPAASEVGQVGTSVTSGASAHNRVPETDALLEAAVTTEAQRLPIPEVRVFDYEELKQNDLW